MTDRSEIIQDFIAKTVWKSWQQNAIPGDASARRYWRLTDGAQTVILMDDAPELGGSTVPFAQIAGLLKSGGLCAPDILAHDPDQGLMVITDLGTKDVAAWLRTHPGQEKSLYKTATDVLLQLHRIAAPDHLDRLTPSMGADLLDLVGTFYAQRDITDLQTQMQAAFLAFAPTADTLALRDFHAENLMWRDKHQGLDQIGLLDFQDAFIAPAGYDLASLLRDARRDVGPDTVTEMVDYFMQHAGVGAAFRTQLACIGVQRNLRILGIFARLSLNMGKARYIDLIPRVWNDILLDLQDPALATLQQAVRDTVPAPTPALLAGLRV